MNQRTIRLREHKGLTVITYSHDELIVRTPSHSVIFHAWFAPRVTRAATFRNFQKDLLRRKVLALDDIYRLAQHHDVQCIVDKYGKAQRIIERGKHGATDKADT